MVARRIIQAIVIIACFLQLALSLGSVQPVWADNAEVSMFYDALAPYGNWVDYGKYGPVTSHQVSSSWRPYLDGRWTPAAAAGSLKPPSLGVGHLPLRQLDAHHRLRLGLVSGQHLVSFHHRLAHQR